MSSDPTPILRHKWVRPEYAGFEYCYICGAKRSDAAAKPCPGRPLLAIDNPLRK